MSIYKDASLFDLETYQFDLLQEWAQQLYFDDLKILGPVLILQGSHGTGKTRTVHALNRAFAEWDRHYDGDPTTLEGIAYDLRISIHTELEICLDVMGFDRVGNVDKYYLMPQILCIDDFGQQVDRPSAMNIQHIIDKRTSAGQATVITTNLTPDEISEERGRTVADRLWTSEGTQVLYEGKSRR